MSNCIEHVGCVSRDGYGQVTARRFGRKITRAHVLAWIDTHGQLPPDDRPNILHTCDNPPCKNPEHLYAGTQADNVQDMVRRGRLNISAAVAAAAEEKLSRTHCRREHEFTDENTKLVRLSNGRIVRSCRTCERARWRKYYRRHRAAEIVEDDE